MLHILDNNRLSFMLPLMDTMFVNGEEVKYLAGSFPAWTAAATNPLFYAGIVLGTIILTPLDVILARMSVIYPTHEEDTEDGMVTKPVLDAELHKVVEGETEKAESVGLQGFWKAETEEKLDAHEQRNASRKAQAQEVENASEQPTSSSKAAGVREHRPQAFRYVIASPPANTARLLI